MTRWQAGVSGSGHEITRSCRPGVQETGAIAPTARPSVRHDDHDGQRSQVQIHCLSSLVHLTHSVSKTVCVFARRRETERHAKHQQSRAIQSSIKTIACSISFLFLAILTQTEGQKEGWKEEGTPATKRASKNQERGRQKSQLMSRDYEVRDER